MTAAEDGGREGGEACRGQRQVTVQEHSAVLKKLLFLALFVEKCQSWERRVVSAEPQTPPPPCRDGTLGICFYTMCKV